ncbi:MAG: hypothetical protein AAGH46_00530 [Bacteroidota bacterium]
MKKLHCSLFGHDYKISREITYYVKEYKCRHCGHEVTINANGTIVPLTKKHRQINAVLAQIHQKRLGRGQQLFMIRD